MGEERGAWEDIGALEQGGRDGPHSLEMRHKKEKEVCRRQFSWSQVDLRGL